MATRESDTALSFCVAFLLPNCSRETSWTSFVFTQVLESSYMYVGSVYGVVDRFNNQYCNIYDIVCNDAYVNLLSCELNVN